MLPHVVSDQSEVFEFLGKAASFGITEAVKRIDTHGAALFLAGPDVYKVKRAVRFPFMDFSTLDKRRAACEEEILANRHNAPDIYLGVTAITRSLGALHLGGEGEVVEWAVHMRRFDENATLDKVARRDGLAPDMVAELAAAVARAHRQAPVKDFDSRGALAGYIAENGESLAEMAETFPIERARRLTSAAFEQLLAHGDLLSERRRAGFVRRCHGDLHLRNIAVIDGKPVLFDALEFDVTMATCDVLYDLAFLIMDLWERGFEQEANACLNRYLWEQAGSDHMQGLALLPLFLSVRATIRAKVIGLSLPQLDEGQRALATLEAQRYFALAEEFLTAKPPLLVAVGGLSGTGKTTVAALVAPRVGRIPGAVHIRSDIERKLMLGVSAREHLAESGYTAATSADVYARMRLKARIALAAGFAVVADAVHVAAEERERIERVAHDLCRDFAGFWLEAPLELRIARVQLRHSDASDADAAYLIRQPKVDPKSLFWDFIDASGAAASIADTVVSRLHRQSAQVT